MKLKLRPNSSFILLTLLGSLAVFILYLYSHQAVSLYEDAQHSIHLLASKGKKRPAHFNIHTHILAFLHIQKTGGSDFDRNIVKHLLVKKDTASTAWRRACSFINSHVKTTLSPIKRTNKFKKFACTNDKLSKANAEANWYFSRQTFGWVCGLHPGMTELSECVARIYPDTRPESFFYFTILREPVRRFLSEWQHVSRGATWKRKNSKECSSNEYDKCLRKGAKTWTNVTLDEFMACGNNPAFNRQTKMLAYYDSRIARCNYEHRHDRDLLIRAKATLDSLAFFALNEFQSYSERLFENSFGSDTFRFDKRFQQSNTSLAEKFLEQGHNEKQYADKIRKSNYLDVQLYEYAMGLFFERLKHHAII